MSNRNSQDLNKQFNHSSRLDEDELWDLDEEWEEVTGDESIDAPPTETPAPAEIEPSLQTEEPKDQDPTDDQDSFEEPETTTSASHESEEPAQKQEGENEEIQKSTSSGLSLIEKATLATLAAALLGLAIYSYNWLYKKNLTAEVATLELPVQGNYITISNFSTHWSEGSGNNTKILPVASITLDSEANSTGALRIFFRDAQSNIIGDPITLAVSNSRFVVAESHNIKILDNGTTAEIMSSDGFNQESDFSAYVLDRKMAWKAFVYEAKQASASGQEFEKNKIIHVNIDAKRK